MRFAWLDPRFGCPRRWPRWLLAGYLVPVHPLVGRRRYARLVRHGHPGGLTRYFRTTVAIQTTLAALVLPAVAADSRLNSADVGLRWPVGTYRREATAFAAVPCMALLLSAIPARKRARRGKRIPGVPAAPLRLRSAVASPPDPPQ